MIYIYIFIVGIYQHISHIWETSWNTEATTFSGERVSACTAVWGRPGLEKCSEGNHPVLCVHDMLKYIIYIDVCVCLFYVCINFNIEPRNCWCCYIYIYHPNFDPALVWHRHGSRLVIRGLYPSPNRYILQILSNLPSSKLTWQLLKMKILNMLVDQRVK